MAEKVKKEKKKRVPLKPFEIFVIIMSVLLIIATVATGVVKHTIDNFKINPLAGAENKFVPEPWMLDIADRFIPDTMEIEDSKEGITFTVNVSLDKNFDFENAKGFEYLNLLQVSDLDGNSIGMEDNYKDYQSITGLTIRGEVLLQIADIFVEVKEKVNNVFSILIVLDILFGILLAYVIWKRADDRREEREKELAELNVQRAKGMTEEEVKEHKANQNKQNKKKKKKKK